MSNMHVVIGAGISGFATLEFLIQQSIPCILMDTRLSPPNMDLINSRYPDLPIYLGELNPAVLRQAKTLVVSPGIAIASLPINFHTEQIEVIGDIELFVRHAKAPIVAITGTNGKSTVTSLVGEMCQAAGMNTKVGGNLGPPVLSLLDDDADIYVLELSSFQLETTHSLSAEVATILNVSPDHLDRYDSYDAYVAAKHRIYRQAKTIVQNADEELTQVLSTEIDIYSFTRHLPNQPNQFGLIEDNTEIYLANNQGTIINVKELPLPGIHNWLNYLAAIAMGVALKIDLADIVRACKEFTGLPHRCEYLGEENGVAWYNDSKGTNIGATIAAVEGLGKIRQGQIVLIAGGQGKGADFRDLSEVVKKHVKKMIVMGEDAALIEKALQQDCEIFQVSSMAEAVTKARQCAEKEDAVLLSPACASFDMFKNFQHRGEVFCEIVRGFLS